MSKTDKQKFSRRSFRRSPRRFRRHSTKKRLRFRSPTHPGRWLLGGAAAVVIVLVALLWGNALKEKSDAYRSDRDAGKWTLPPEDSVHSPAVLPDRHLLEIKPEGNVGDIIIYNSHDGVVLPLRDAAGGLYYRSDVATEAGLTIPADAVSLASDVERVSRRGLHVAGVYRVSCFDSREAALQAYRRGLDLALLYEYAASGIHEILLLGLPCGTDGNDALSVAFLKELKVLLSALPSPPAVTVALPLSAFGGEVTPPDGTAEADTEAELLVGSLSPGRLGLVSDAIALDLRTLSVEETDALLPRVAYIYGRYGLSLLVNRDMPAIAEDMESHGFTRIYEMRTDS